MTKSSVKSLGDSLQELLRQLGIEKKVKQYSVLESWEDIVGEKISKIAEAYRIDDEILYVKVKSMTWRTELSFQKLKILKKIEDKVGKHIIKDIRFY